MAKKADRFELKFTHRGSWIVERIAAGRVIDAVPVTWSKDFRTDEDTGGEYQKVNHHDASNMEARLRDLTPFAFALAEAKDYAVHPHSVKTFQGVYEGAVAGRILFDRSLEIEVLRRLKAG
jgi:hypothetical protein